MLTGLLLLGLSIASAAPPTTGPTDPPEPAQVVPQAPPPPDPCQGAPPDRSASFSDELERAKRMYRDGCHDWTLTLLQDLDVRRRLAPTDAELEIDQRLYLGEVLLVLGRRQEARDTFELLLTEHPEARMGLLEHDPDAVNLMERVRAEVAARGPTLPPEIPPRPARPFRTYLPFGVGHRFNEDRGAALGFGLTQAGLAITAATTLVIYEARYRGLKEVDDDTPELLAQIWRVRAINWASAVGFVITYAASQSHLSRRYERRWTEQHTPKLTISPAGIGIQGRF